MFLFNIVLVQSKGGWLAGWLAGMVLVNLVMAHGYREQEVEGEGQIV